VGKINCQEQKTCLLHCVYEKLVLILRIPTLQKRDRNELIRKGGHYLYCVLVSDVL
jgi:hypothetical protein